MPSVAIPCVTVRVVACAQLRDRLDASTSSVTLPAPATGQALLRRLCECYPAAAPLLAVTRLAVNCEYVALEAPLQDGDEVILIPPVSGG